MKNVKIFGLITSIVLLLFTAGCSGRMQVNPMPTNSKINLNAKFNEAQKLSKLTKLAYTEGYNKGYEHAKKEIAKIIPYLKSLHAAAILKENKMLCLPPVFIDKRNGQIKLIIGKAHLCEDFTLKNVLNITKNGIPGLPNYIVKKNRSNLKNNSKNDSAIYSSISIATTKKQPVSFIGAPKQIIKTVVVIKDNFTNREILRNSNYPISNIQSKNNYLTITFPNNEDRIKFCSTYKICKN